MDKTLKDNLRTEFQEILERKDYADRINSQSLDPELLQSAFDVLLDRSDDETATAFINNIINTIKTKTLPLL